MPAMYYKYHPPGSSDDFEHLVKECLNACGKCFNEYGRKGQNQHGIDLYDNKSKTVCQCKSYFKKKLTTKIIKDDIDRAIEYFPKIKQIIIATIAERDTKIDDVVYNYSNVQVQMLYWDDLARILKENPSIANRFYTNDTGVDATNLFINRFVEICDKYTIIEMLENEDFLTSFKDIYITSSDYVHCELSELLHGEYSINVKKYILKDIKIFMKKYDKLFSCIAQYCHPNNRGMAIPLDNISDEVKDSVIKMRTYLYEVAYRYKYGE